LANAMGVAALAWFVYMFYGITLSRLEYNAKLEDLNKKN
jgi:hypothetical protein